MPVATIEKQSRSGETQGTTDAMTVAFRKPRQWMGKVGHSLTSNVEGAEITMLASTLKSKSTKVSSRAYGTIKSYLISKTLQDERELNAQLTAHGLHPERNTLDVHISSSKTNPVELDLTVLQHPNNNQFADSVGDVLYAKQFVKEPDKLSFDIYNFNDRQVHSAYVDNNTRKVVSSTNPLSNAESAKVRGRILGIFGQVQSVISGKSNMVSALLKG